MNNSDIISALKTKLEGAAGLSFVKQVLVGARQVETITMFPTLIIEPISEAEEQAAYTVFENRLTVSVSGLINVVNPELQITGDANTKGILDFVNDVKTAIDADYTLGGTANHIVMKDTQYSSDLFPVRMFALEIEIWFRQIKGNRS